MKRQVWDERCLVRMESNTRIKTSLFVSIRLMGFAIFSLVGNLDVDRRNASFLALGDFTRL